MPFITQGKTNWKYILIVLILATIVGGGIFWLLQKKVPSSEIFQQKALELANQVLQSKCKTSFTEIKKEDWQGFKPGSIPDDIKNICPEIEAYKENKMWIAEKTLDEYTRAVSYIGIDGKFVCVFAVRRVAPGIMSLDQACPPETDETTDWKTYQSPDGALSAQIIPAKKNLLGNAYESRVEIRTEEGKLLKTADYTSEDGDHGLIVANTEWNPDSQFFIYSAYSSGGHSPWFSRVYFYNRNDNKLYDFSEASGFTVANDEFSVTAPDIVTFTVYTCVGMGPTTTKSFKLSDVIGNPPVNLPYCYE